MQKDKSVFARLVALILLFPWGVVAILACGSGGGDEEVVPLPVLDCPEGFIEAPSRGIACLHCNHPHAQGQANILTDTIVNACIRNVSWNVLVSGTFGYDEAFMMRQVDKLTTNRHLSLTLYLLNGPGQRRYKSKIFDGFGEKISPEDFRNRIQWDETFRDSYRNHVAQFVPLIDYAIAHGATVNIVPQLEDNMSDNAFMALEKLTQQVLAGKPVRWGRNPCPSCYDGNQAWIPPGNFEEEHTDKPHFNVRSGIVTNDGDDVGANYTALNPVRDRAAQLGNEFIVWTAKYQGVGVDGKLIDPDIREYSVPSSSEIMSLVKSIRGE